MVTAKQLPKNLLTTTVLALLILLLSSSVASAAIRIGVYSGANGESTSLESSATLDKYIAKVGKAPAFVVDYRNVTAGQLLTESEIANLSSHGTGALITWQLFKKGWGGEAITLPEITAGKYDSAIRSAAQQAKGLPFEVMIRFAHEMNGDWYPWGTEGSSLNTGSNYVDAWRHVVSIFRAEGAVNVKWVWSPNVDYDGSYPFASYFPGDEWIDYVALDGYNWGTAGQGPDAWQTFSEVFATAYGRLTSLSAKPVMIAETASSETGGDKAAWIRKSFLEELPQRFPRVTDVVWFDRNQELDWRIDSSSASLAAFREVVNSTLYGGTVPPPVVPTNPPKKKPKPKTLRELRVTRKVDVATTGAAAQPQAEQALSGFRVEGEIRYRLGTRAKVKLQIERRTRKGRFATKTTFRGDGKPGSERIPLSRLARRMKFRPGVYRVTVTARDAEGLESDRRASFRVRRSR
jgi:hypothetical protein